MTTCLGKLFIWLTMRAFRKLLSIYTPPVFSYFPFGFEGRMWVLIVSLPDHCLSFFFATTNKCGEEEHGLRYGDGRFEIIIDRKVRP